MEQFKNFNERVKASGATQKMLQQPLDRGKAAHLKLKVKNVIGDLDGIAWKLENQLDMPDMPATIKVVKHIDSIIKDIRTLDKELKKVLKV